MDVSEHPLLNVFQPGECGVAKHGRSASCLNVWSTVHSTALKVNRVCCLLFMLTPPTPTPATWTKPESTRTRQRSHREGRGFTVRYWIFRRQVVKAWVAGWNQRRRGRQPLFSLSLAVITPPAVALIVQHRWIPFASFLMAYLQINKQGSFSEEFDEKQWFVMEDNGLVHREENCAFDPHRCTRGWITTV